MRQIAAIFILAVFGTVLAAPAPLPRSPKPLNVVIVGTWDLDYGATKGVMVFQKNGVGTWAFDHIKENTVPFSWEVKDNKFKETNRFTDGRVFVYVYDLKVTNDNLLEGICHTENSVENSIRVKLVRKK